jgi:mono/diheme cytochrome c family protein
MRFRNFLVVAAGVLMGALIFGQRPTHALPDYAARTGEPCATCHINPAGGGPRNQRGLLWVAAGKPDKVPELPGKKKAAPGAVSGADIYKNEGCSGCHGASGEGLIGPPLNQNVIAAETITSAVRAGKGAMPAFPPDKLSDEDLKVLIDYVQSLPSGGAEGAAPTQVGPQPLPAAKFICSDNKQPAAEIGSCGGN